jgi:hypothetical protein
LPSQLGKLTSLTWQYAGGAELDGSDVAGQLQHLSSLTALKEFRFDGTRWTPPLAHALAPKLFGLVHLEQLTSLELAADFKVSSSSVSN